MSVQIDVSKMKDALKIAISTKIDTIANLEKLRYTLEACKEFISATDTEDEKSKQEKAQLLEDIDEALEIIDKWFSKVVEGIVKTTLTTLQK